MDYVCTVGENSGVNGCHIPKKPCEKGFGENGNCYETDQTRQSNHEWFGKICKQRVTKIPEQNPKYNTENALMVVSHKCICTLPHWEKDCSKTCHKEGI